MFGPRSTSTAAPVDFDPSLPESVATPAVIRRLRARVGFSSSIVKVLYELVGPVDPSFRALAGHHFGLGSKPKGTKGRSIQNCSKRRLLQAPILLRSGVKKRRTPLHINQEISPSISSHLFLSWRAAVLCVFVYVTTYSLHPPATDFPGLHINIFFKKVSRYSSVFDHKILQATCGFRGGGVQ